MEQLLSSLVFSGSIIEAITEAKRQKKLFVVFVSGGFISADNLASSLEKAWLSLHIQETTATFLTAAPASKKELVSGGSSVTSEVGSSSSAQVSPAQAGTRIQSPMDTLSKNSYIVEGEDRGHAAAEIDSSVIVMASHGPADAFESRIGELNESITVVTTAEKPLDLVEVDSTKAKDECSMSKENPGLCDQQLDPIDEAPGEIANKARKGPEINIVEDAAAEKASFSDASSNTFHDVYLNIRLPDGSSLQAKFAVMDTLRMVKHYVDKNQTSSFGSYDLAVPYPRKVFGNEDLDRTLSDLCLHNRQALIIVLRNKVNVTSMHGQNNSAESNHTASGDDAGYFARIRRLFSYVNPLSYLGGRSNTSNTARDSQDSIWQYGPSPTPQNNQTLVRKPFQTPITTTTNNRGRKPASSRFGSNIHTLKHDEDENQFGDRNTFWNGNSTQFGGDDNSK